MRATEPVAIGEVEAAPTSGAVKASAGYETGVAPNVIAEFSDCAGLHVALRSVREKRNISFETLDEIVGAPKGYFSKVLALNGERCLTMRALEWIMAGLGVRAIFVDDPAALKQINGRMRARDATVVRLTQTHYVMTNRRWAQIARLGREARWRGKSQKERTAAARRAALARWRNGGS